MNIITRAVLYGFSYLEVFVSRNELANVPEIERSTTEHFTVSKSVTITYSGISGRHLNVCFSVVDDGRNCFLFLFVKLLEP